MKLFEKQTVMPYPIEDVFALTVDLENAPHWHIFFTDVEQLTAGPIGIGTSWKISYGIGSFMLEINDCRRPNHVEFKGSPIFGIVPNFTIELQAVTEGTLVEYKLHPNFPTLFHPFVQIFAPPFGNRDLDRYFRELNTILSRA
jgi:hypothetical protein